MKEKNKRKKSYKKRKRRKEKSCTRRVDNVRRRENSKINNSHAGVRIGKMVNMFEMNNEREK